MASSSMSSVCSETTLGLLTPTIISPFKRDLYCWVCHLSVGPLLKCKTCPRSFHRNCAHQLGSISPNAEPLLDPRNPNPDVIRSCPECQMGSRTILPNMKESPAQEVKLICQAISRNLRDGYFHPNPFHRLELVKSPTEYQSYKDIVARVVDISLLEEMAAADYFSTLEGFLGEVKWIYHNTVIVHGKCTREATKAKEIIDICELEILAAELCPECYLREQNRANDDMWFIRGCERTPHPLGWAKTPESPNWPVKIMHWAGGEEPVTVRSFADYRRFDLPPQKCILYTKFPPKFDSHRVGGKVEEVKEAQKEVEMHIVELEKVMGKVRLPDRECRLSSLVSMDKAIRYMFPELQRIWCPFAEEEGEKMIPSGPPPTPSLKSDLVNNNVTPGSGRMN